MACKELYILVWYSMITLCPLLLNKSYFIEKHEKTCRKTFEIWVIIPVFPSNIIHIFIVILERKKQSQNVENIIKSEEISIQLCPFYMFFSWFFLFSDYIIPKQGR